MQEVRERRKNLSTTGVQGPPTMLPQPLPVTLQPTAKKKAVTFKIPAEPATVLEEAVVAGDQLLQPQAEGGSSGSTQPAQAPASIVPVAPVQASVPELITDPTQYLDEARTKVINGLVDFIHPRIANGGNWTVQTGIRMKALQEVFGGTSNRVILAAGFYKKPSSNVGPEPLVSRDIAP